MTAREHIYAIKNLLAHGPAPDDFAYSNELILHFLQVARARLIEQKADKYRFISQQSYQDLCLNLELSNFHNCCDGPELDCKILKSTIQLPKFLNSKWGNFVSVMDLSGRILPEINLTQNRFSEYAIVKPKTGWFIHDNHLYLVNNIVLTKVLLNALFDSPDEIKSINCSSGNGNCEDPIDSEFPIDPDLIDPMYRLTLEFLIQSTRLPNDIENNSKNVEVVQAIQ